MNAGLPHRSLQYFCKLQSLGNELVAGVSFLCQFRNFGICFREFYPGLFGNQLGQPVGIGKRKLLNPCNIPYGSLCSHGAECDYMGNLVVTILVHHISKDILPSVLIKVDVDIGHRDTVEIEESFKQQAVFYRIYVGYFQTPGNC